ncbi:MAG: DNA topoisomerase [Blastocatellia bacterium]|nr:MAG: DNA topoisomerase [Blastocatellia bacterium]
MTGVERLQSTGIIRIGTPQRGFRYRCADGGRVVSEDLQRIRHLRIPPAWINVAISSSPAAKVQAVGVDTAGRWQYLYHENHTKLRAQVKYRRLIHFIEVLPQMRITVARHLRQPDLGRERILACIVRVLSTCFFRPGSEVYASENGSYGIATLKPRHVVVRGNLVRFDFRGKSGVLQTREFSDRHVARVLKELLKCRNSEVFKFRSEDGQFVDVKRRHINEYIKEAMGERFSAKDFRTWAGTMVCACALARIGTDESDDAVSRKRKIADAIKETSLTLGNTPAVCRSSYICPEVIENFQKGRTIKHFFPGSEAFISYRGTKLHRSERALLRLLK